MHRRKTSSNSHSQSYGVDKSLGVDNSWTIFTGGCYCLIDIKVLYKQPVQNQFTQSRLLSKKRFH